jgi:hypothetical protein
MYAYRGLLPKFFSDVRTADSMREPIFYWRGNAEVLTDILDALASRGDLVVQCRSVEELVEKVSEHEPRLLIVDASSGEREASDRVVELSGATRLFPVPTAFISSQASKRISVLQRSFLSLRPIDFPYNVESVLGQLDLMSSVDEDPREKEKRKQAEKERRRLLHCHADPGQLRGSCGGALFGLASSAEDFDDAVLIPKSTVRPAIELNLKEMALRSPWLAVHARRVSYLSSSTSSQLNLGQTWDAPVRIASLFLNWDGKAGREDSAKENVFRTLNGEAITRIQNNLSSGAAFVEKEIKDPKAASLLKSAAEVLEKGTQDDSPEAAAAYCMLTAELIDRACFENGAWNLFGAYTCVRRIREKALFLNNDKINHAFLRALSEAGSSKVTVVNFFGADALSPRDAEINIHELHEGMVLEQPLETLDGKTLLHAKTRLTRNTVLDLWQLGLIRALRRPTISQTADQS